MLKTVKNENLSPIPQVKAEDITISFTLANAKNNNPRSRNSSVDSFVNRSLDISTKIKTRKAGAAIGDLVSKLRSSRKSKK